LPGQETPNAIPRDLVIETLTSKFVLALGSLLSLVSLGTLLHGKVNRISFGCDFQWSAVRILLSHRDPWAIYLAGDSRGEFLLNQVPNYPHELYVVLFPFGLLPFSEARIIWAFVNLVLVCVTCFCIAHLYELPKLKLWLLFVMVGTSAPFRESIRNGQLNGLSIACIALWALVNTQRGRGLLLGLSYTKYSLPPVLVLFLLLRKRWRLLLYSVVPPLAGFLILYAWLREPALKLALEPLKTATHPGALTPGSGNIIVLSSEIREGASSFSSWSIYLPQAIGLLFGLLIALYFSRQGGKTDGRILLACLMTASLICFPHLFYDYYLIVFCLAIALKARPSLTRNFSLVVIAYLWYVAPILHTRVASQSFSLDVIVFGALLTLIGLTNSMKNTTNWSTSWEI
jgi:Glycosyltransferase family 87